MRPVVRDKFLLLRPRRTSTRTNEDVDASFLVAVPLSTNDERIAIECNGRAELITPHTIIRDKFLLLRPRRTRTNEHVDASSI